MVKSDQCIFSNFIDKVDRRYHQTPDEKVLRKLSERIGNCTIELGIELGLSVSDIEESIYRYEKDIYRQIYDILLKWKRLSKVKSLHILMKALQFVRPEGVYFLMKEFDLQ